MKKKIFFILLLILVGVTAFKAGQVSTQPKGVSVQVKRYTAEVDGKKYPHELIEVKPDKPQNLELASWDSKNGQNKKIVMDYSEQAKE